MKKNKSLEINAILNVIKQCCGIIFPLVTYPYISRVLQADNIGVYGFCDSIICIGITIALLGVNSYGVREGAAIRNDKVKFEKFANEIFTISLFSGIIVYILMFALILNVEKIQDNVVVFIILSINIIANILGQDWINQLFEDYFYLTVRYIIFHVFALVAMFVFVKDKNDLVIYTLIMVIANSGGLILNLLYISKYVPLRVTLHLNLKKHIKPMCFLLGVSLAVQIYVKSDVIMLGLWRNENETGIYTIVSKIYSILKMLINAIITVYIPRLAYCFGTNRDDYIYLLSELKNNIKFVLFPTITCVFFLSEEIIILISGIEFISGAIALKVLCIALVFAVLACYYTSCILVIQKKDKIFFWITIFSALVNVGLNFLLIDKYGMNGAAITTVLAEMFVVIACKKITKNGSELKLKESEWKCFISCMAIAIIITIIKCFVSSLVYRFIVAVLLSAIIYFFINYIFKNSTLIYYINLLNIKKDSKEL